MRKGPGISFHGTFKDIHLVFGIRYAGMRRDANFEKKYLFLTYVKAGITGIIYPAGTYIPIKWNVPPIIISFPKYILRSVYNGLPQTIHFPPPPLDELKIFDVGEG